MATQAKAMDNSKQVRFIAHLICGLISLSPNMISSTPNPGAQLTANILPHFKSGYLIGDIESLTPNKRKHRELIIHLPTIPGVRVQCHYVHTDSRRRSRRVTTPRGRSRQSAQLQSWAPLAQRCHGRAPMEFPPAPLNLEWWFFPRVNHRSAPTPTLLEPSADLSKLL